MAFFATSHSSSHCLKLQIATYLYSHIHVSTIISNMQPFKFYIWMCTSRKIVSSRSLVCGICITKIHSFLQKILFHSDSRYSLSIILCVASNEITSKSKVLPHAGNLLLKVPAYNIYNNTVDRFHCINFSDFEQLSPTEAQKKSFFLKFLDGAKNLAKISLSLN